MQDALFPLRRTWISQGMNGKASHLGILAIDFGVLSSDRDDELHAPFDGTVVWVDSLSKGGAVAFQSDEKVQFANGEQDYMTLITGHDNYPPKVGAHFKQNEVYSHMGTAGGVGKHCHLQTQRGKFRKATGTTSQGSYKFPNTIAPYDALFLTADSLIDDSASVVTYPWKYIDNVVQPVARDSSKNQLKVLVSSLRIRNGHSISSQQLGYAVKGGIYDWYEKKQGSFAWYRIADKQWIADDGTYLEILERVDTDRLQAMYNKLLEDRDKLKSENAMLLGKINKIKEIVT